jgi:hypothetical protein
MHEECHDRIHGTIDRRRQAPADPEIAALDGVDDEV